MPLLASKYTLEETIRVGFVIQFCYPVVTPTKIISDLFPDLEVLREGRVGVLQPHFLYALFWGGGEGDLRICVRTKIKKRCFYIMIVWIK